jgi:beta-alanine--pyruvate transaminase
MVRFTGDSIAVSPPLVIERGEIDTLFETLGKVIADVA